MLFRGLDPLPDGAAKASTPLNWLKTIEALIEALHLSISLEVPEDVDRFRFQLVQVIPGRYG